jgi:hypothetical protein
MFVILYGFGQGAEQMRIQQVLSIGAAEALV